LSEKYIIYTKIIELIVNKISIVAIVFANCYTENRTKECGRVAENALHQNFYQEGDMIWKM
jgi:hypothetical protein